MNNFENLDPESVTAVAEPLAVLIINLTQLFAEEGLEPMMCVAKILNLADEISGFYEYHCDSNYEGAYKEMVKVEMVEIMEAIVTEIYSSHPLDLLLQEFDLNQRKK